MKITLNIDDDLIERATKLTGIATKTELVRVALQVLVSSESAHRLARLGGSEPQLGEVRRRRLAETAKNTRDAFSAEDLKYWLSRTPQERIEAVQILRRMKWGKALDQPIARVVKKRNRNDPEE